MSARNKLLDTPPYPVELTLKQLGANLRTARLRRNLTIRELAEKIGTGNRAVMDAEKGKPATSVAVYTALLWALGLIDQLSDVASPERDEEGKLFALAGDRERARPDTGLSNDF